MTPIERLAAWLEQGSNGERNGASKVLLGDDSTATVTMSDLQKILTDARTDARQAAQLGDMYRHAIERAKDRDEWKRKAEEFERTNSSLRELLRVTESECASQSGRAAAFFEALKLVCGVRE